MEKQSQRGSKQGSSKGPFHINPGRHFWDSELMFKSQLINRPRIWLMRTFPGLYVSLARTVAKGMFAQERRALAGRLAPAATTSSVLHFCYNRCGSRYVSGLIQQLLAPRGYLAVDFDRYFTHCNRAGVEKLRDPDFAKTRLLEQGVHFGPFYRLHEGFTDLDGYRIVLTLRDPRDVLTSRFYSQAYAHTLFDKQGIARRERFREMGIDAVVLDQAPEIIERYTRYHDELLGRENVLFLPYEEMVGDFDKWLDRLAEFLGSGAERALLDRIRAEADFSVKKEDKYSHRRSVKPGNHAEKLRSETVMQLNEQLAGILEMFGYAKPEAKL